MTYYLWKGKLLFRHRFGQKLAMDPQCCCGCMNCCDKPSTITMDVTGALVCSITMTKLRECDAGGLQYQGTTDGIDPTNWCNSSVTGLEGDPINVSASGTLECSTDGDGREFWVITVQVAVGAFPKCIIRTPAIIDSWSCTPLEFYAHDFTDEGANPGICACGDGQRVDIHIHE